MSRTVSLARRARRVAAALIEGGGAAAILVAGVLVAAILVSAAYGLSRAVGAEPAGAGQESALHFDVQFRETFVAPAGLVPGAQILLNDLLLIDGREVGHNGGVCVVVGPAAGTCSATYALPDGTVTTQFLLDPAPVKPFAITGGTGAYVGARGEGELVEYGDGPADGSGGTGHVTFMLSGR